MTKPSSSVLIVGGGISGMQAAIDLAEAGYMVYLAEKESAIGGRMVQLDKTFPTNDCSMCTISPRLVQIGMNPNINILTNTSLEKLEGESPNFTAHLKTMPRFVDVEKCKSCGECEAVCPVSIPKTFDMGMSRQKAIYKRYPQAAPNAYAISKKGTAPCKNACPAHVHTQGYIALVRASRFKEALALIRRDLPLPSICGRACAHPCEDACYRGDRDQSVSIRSIKRYVADLENEFGQDCLPKTAELIPNHKIAVIGAGPAGLSAAYFLAIKGCSVTVFEALPEAGGMMRYGVPSYRLPRDVIQTEVNQILSLGVRLVTNAPIQSISDLFTDGYKKIFIATGLHQGRKLGIPGENLPNVLQGIDFLKRVALGEVVTLGSRVAVIGGGNVAVDVARTCRRLGASSVMMICLEQSNEMPADEEEIEESIEEGIKILDGFGPKQFDSLPLGISLTLKQCISCFDKNGHFAPKYNEDELQSCEVDSVVIAVGQQGDPDTLRAMGLTLEYGKFTVHPVSLITSTPNVYAGGDLVSGPKSIIEAVAMGRRAAESIVASFESKPIDSLWPNLLDVVPRDISKTGKAVKRVRDQKRDPADRINDFDEVVSAFQTVDAVLESERCMNCGDCSECLQCVTVCTSGAVNHDDRPKIQTVNIGAVLLSPGFDQFDTKLLGEYGFGRFANVVSSLMLERMLSASGPTKGHIERPSDSASPKKIAWLQCVGSRDERKDKPYCSAVCCMFATKQALIIRDHYPTIETDIFYMDMRAYGKGFDSYVDRAKNTFGVRYHRGMISKIYELPEDRSLELRYVDEFGELKKEVFDLVVLSSGITPGSSVKQLAAICGVSLNEFGFAKKTITAPNKTEKPGVYVSGVIEGPRDIPETVVSASSAAALIGADISESRWSGISPKIYPPEKNVSQETPRIGVFICRCGTNIARVVDVPTLTEYAKTLPNVVHAEENLYTCSADTQLHLAEKIAEHRLNRVVVASCTPRTHEPLFQETLRDAGLNKYLFEMANIRDQCSWVHAGDADSANDKAKDLLRMAAARAARLAPLTARSIDVTKSALVVGGGVSGMSAALSLASQGFFTSIVEKEAQLGGNTRRLTMLEDGSDPSSWLTDLIRKTISNPKIQIFTDAALGETKGHIGRFISQIKTKDGTKEVPHGVTIIAVGALPYSPVNEYQFGHHPGIVTQLDLEQLLRIQWADAPKQVVMIQCVGSREGDTPVCSRVCCTQAVKNAIRIKTLSPSTEVFIFYRDVRTYGLRELLYRDARKLGVLFVRYTPDSEPIVSLKNDKITVLATDLSLKTTLNLHPDMVVLSTGIRPANDSKSLATLLKLPLGQDGFFSEAHMKLRPVDVAAEGYFLAGLAHGPKLLDECISQAQGAAARAATILAKTTLPLSAEISEVDTNRCVGCLTCVRSCPYNVPKIGENRTAEIEPAACQGCGICAAACPRKAIITCHSTDDQILAKVEALFEKEAHCERFQ